VKQPVSVFDNFFTSLNVMSKYSYGIPIDIDRIDFSWMVGRTFVDITFHEPDLWSLKLADGGLIGTESLWRIIETGRFTVCSKDHGHKFGLPAPVDSTSRAMSVLSGAIVTNVEIRKDTMDLIIQLNGERRLEIISYSHVYQTWDVNDPFGHEFIAEGGRICEIKAQM
jgi:hypothetical protein